MPALLLEHTTFLPLTCFILNLLLNIILVHFQVLISHEYLISILGRKMLCSIFIWIIIIIWIVSINSWALFYLTNTFCCCNKYQTEIIVLIQDGNQRAEISRFTKDISVFWTGGVFSGQVFGRNAGKTQIQLLMTVKEQQAYTQMVCLSLYQVSLIL